MKKENQTIALGWVYEDHSEVSKAIEELFGETPYHVQVPGLAGPNDLIQLLATVDGWETILELILGIYGSGIIAEAGKDTWRALAPKLRQAPSNIRDKFLKLIEALQKEQEAGRDVSIGLSEPILDFHARRDRVYLRDLSPEEVARHLYIFGHCAKPLTKWFTAIHAELKSPEQIYVEIVITDDGNLVVTITPGWECTEIPLGITKKVFNSKGELLEEY